MDTLIIGAGPAGLAVAGRLRKLEIPFEVIEQTEKSLGRGTIIMIVCVYIPSSNSLIYRTCLFQKRIHFTYRARI